LNCDKTLENIPYGEDRTFTISAKDGWEISKVYVNNQSVKTTNNQFVINDIDKMLYATDSYQGKYFNM